MLVDSWKYSPHTSQGSEDVLFKAIEKEGVPLVRYIEKEQHEQYERDIADAFGLCAADPRRGTVICAADLDAVLCMLGHSPSPEELHGLLFELDPDGEERWFDATTAMTQDIVTTAVAKVAIMRARFADDLWCLR